MTACSVGFSWVRSLLQRQSCCKADLMPNDTVRLLDCGEPCPSRNELKLCKKKAHPKWPEPPEARGEERKKYWGPACCRGAGCNLSAPQGVLAQQPPAHHRGTSIPWVMRQVKDGWLQLHKEPGMIDGPEEKDTIPWLKQKLIDGLGDADDGSQLPSSDSERWLDGEPANAGSAQKVKGNEKLGCHQCQMPAEEEQTQQHFFQTSWETCCGHMKGVDKDSSRMLDTSPVFRWSEFMKCSAKTTGREGDERKDDKTRAGFRVPRVSEQRGKFPAKVKPKKASQPILLPTSARRNYVPSLSPSHPYVIQDHHIEIFYFLVLSLSYQNFPVQGRFKFLSATASLWLST